MTSEYHSQPSTLQNFFVIWFGQFVSGFGTALTRFALVLWVFDYTRSATQQSLISFFSILPALILAPLAGVLADRWDKRIILLISGLGASLSTIALFILLAGQQLEVWHVYLLVINRAIFLTLQIPAFSASIVMIVPKEQLSRANSVVQVGSNLTQLASPIVTGILISLIGLYGIAVIDLMTFIIALASLIISRIPPPATTATAQQQRRSLLQEGIYGWSYLREYPGLVYLLFFFAISNYMLVTVSVLAPSLVLSFAQPSDLGAILSASGCGMLVGGLLMGSLGRSLRPLHGIFGGLLISAIFMMIGGLMPSIVLIGVSAFFIAFGVPMVIISSQTLWQHAVAPDLQGRIAAIRMLVISAGTPIAYLLSGLLADYVFNPLLLPGGALAASVGRLIGTGRGRGTGLLLIVLGMLLIAIVVVGVRSAQLRTLDHVSGASPSEEGSPSLKDAP